MATIIYVCLSFLVAFFRSGRRVLIIYVILGICAVVEIFLTITTFMKPNQSV